MCALCAAAAASLAGQRQPVVIHGLNIEGDTKMKLLTEERIDWSVIHSGCPETESGIDSKKAKKTSSSSEPRESEGKKAKSAKTSSGDEERGGAAASSSLYGWVGVSTIAQDKGY